MSKQIKTDDDPITNITIVLLIVGLIVFLSWCVWDVSRQRQPALEQDSRIERTAKAPIMRPALQQSLMDYRAMHTGASFFRRVWYSGHNVPNERMEMLAEWATNLRTEMERVRGASRDVNELYKAYSNFTISTFEIGKRVMYAGSDDAWRKAVGDPRKSVIDLMLIPYKESYTGPPGWAHYNAEEGNILLSPVELPFNVWASAVYRAFAADQLDLQDRMELDTDDASFYYQALQLDELQLQVLDESCDRQLSRIYQAIIARAQLQRTPEQCSFMCLMGYVEQDDLRVYDEILGLGRVGGDENVDTLFALFYVGLLRYDREHTANRADASIGNDVDMYVWIQSSLRNTPR